MLELINSREAVRDHHTTKYWRIRGRGFVNDTVTGKFVLPLLFGFLGQNLNSVSSRLDQSQWWTNDQLEAYQLKRARFIVDHAHKNFSYFQQLYGRDFSVYDIRDWSSFRQLPVMTKKDLRQLEASSRRPRSSSSRTMVRRTSGSTGEPVVVRTDYSAYTMSLAARFRCLSWHGISRGSREGRFWGGSAKPHLKGRILNYLTNRLVVSPGDLDSQTINELRNRLLIGRPAYLYGYFSLLDRFSDLLIEDGETLEGSGIKVAIVTAEMSSELERTNLAKKLNLEVVNEYGCSEVDIIGFQCEKGGLHIQAENTLLEVSPDDKSIAQEGDALITDLNNRAMPIIRYNVGDWVSLSEERCKCARSLPLIAEVGGRSRDRFIVIADGSMIHAADVAGAIREICDQRAGLRRFFINQDTDSRIVISLYWDSSVKEDLGHKSDELSGYLNKTYGPMVSFIVKNHEHINAIPTNKRSYFSPLGDEPKADQ